MRSSLLFRLADEVRQLVNLPELDFDIVAVSQNVRLCQIELGEHKFVAGGLFRDGVFAVVYDVSCVDKMQVAFKNGCVKIGSVLVYALEQRRGVVDVSGLEQRDCKNLAGLVGRGAFPRKVQG